MLGDWRWMLYDLEIVWKVLSRCLSVTESVFQWKESNFLLNKWEHFHMVYWCLGFPFTLPGKEHRQTPMSGMSRLDSRVRVPVWSAEISWNTSYEKQKLPCKSLITSWLLNQFSGPLFYPGDSGELWWSSILPCAVFSFIQTWKSA